MQHRIVSRLNAALGAALLLSAAAALPAASRNNQQIVPQAQAMKNAAQNYTFVTVDPPGGFCPFVTTINDQRLAAVVYSHDAQCQTSDTILWQDGQFITLPQSLYPNPVVSLGAINNRGTLFGNIGDFDVQHAAMFQLNTGTLTLLPDFPGKPVNMGQTISDSGHGVGQACEGNWFGTYNCTDWVWNGKSYDPLSFDPGIAVDYQYPTGINNRGQIVWIVYVYANNNWNLYAYLQDGAQAINMDVPGAAITFGYYINNSGDVPLNAFDANWALQRYLWRDGALTVLPDVPASWGSIETLVYGVNNRGDYCGVWWDVDSKGHGFVALRK